MSSFDRGSNYDSPRGNSNYYLGDFPNRRMADEGFEQGKRNRRTRRKDSSDCERPAHRDRKNGTTTIVAATSKMRTNTNDSVPNARTRNEKESLRNSTLFRPNRLRPRAPIPSLLRPSHTPSNNSPGNIFTPSYAKHMRSMEFCHSPPRRRLSLGRTPKQMRSNHAVPKSPATIQLQTPKPKRSDRIEQSRHSKFEARTETSLQHDFEDACSTRGIHNESENSAPERVFQRLDRIECTREITVETNDRLKEVSNLRERKDSSRIQTKSIQSNLFGKGKNEIAISMRDQHRRKGHRTEHELISCTSRCTERFPPAMPIRDPKLPRSLYYQDFHTLRLKYSKYIENLIATTDDAEPTTKNDSCEPMIVIRSRALLDHEIEKGNYSVLDVPLQSSRTLALYETNVLPGQNKLDLKAHVFQFDAVFSERDSFDDFYIQTVQPSVDMAMKGGVGIVVVSGSDEFGKANTLSGIETRLASYLFSKCPHVVVTHLGLDSGETMCIDLLSHKLHFAEIHGNKAQGATEMCVSSPWELLDAFGRVKQNLASERILRRESETSSYSLCKIATSIDDDDDKPPGLLYLVQCPAGDQVICGAGERIENKEEEITNPLSNLMEVISRRTTEFCNPPRSNLTKLLGPSILAARDELTRVSLVAAVSPCSEDTDATLSTMLSSREYMTRRSTAKYSDPKLEKSKTTTQEEKEETVVSEEETVETDMTATESLLLPRQWSETQLRSWMEKKHFVSKSDDHRFEGNLSGKAIMNMTKNQLKDCFNCVKKDEANKLFDALRAENDRIARLRVKRFFARKKAKK